MNFRKHFISVKLETYSLFKVSVFCIRDMISGIKELELFSLVYIMLDIQMILS